METQRPRDTFIGGVHSLWALPQRSTFTLPWRCKFSSALSFSLPEVLVLPVCLPISTLQPGSTASCTRPGPPSQSIGRAFTCPQSHVGI